MAISWNSKKWLGFFLIVCVSVGVIFVHTMTDVGNRITNQIMSRSGSGILSCRDTTGGDQKYINQRNSLSQLLNEAKKRFGQQNCDLIKYKQKAGENVDNRISANGGWCSQMSGSNSSAHMWDKGFSTGLSKFLTDKTVASFGDGPGMYKEHLDKLKEVKSYTAFDGAPFCESTTNGRVKFLDLTAPQYGMNAYDWVVSVEVGEHIPKEFQEVFMDNLARHAKEGIILSWGTPGQPGLSHVNNRPLEDVVAAMAMRHFFIRKEEGEPLRQASSFDWLKRNVHVYRRLDQSTFDPTAT